MDRGMGCKIWTPEGYKWGAWSTTVILCIGSIYDSRAHRFIGMCSIRLPAKIVQARFFTHHAVTSLRWGVFAVVAPNIFL